MEVKNSEEIIQLSTTLLEEINELKDELTRVRFGRAYKDCKEDQREAVDKAIPTAISEAEPKNVGGN